MTEQRIKTGRAEVLVPVIFHLHQPVGNFPGTFEHAYKRSYEPLVNELTASGLAFNLHISGALLDWLVEERPGFVEQLGELISEGRLELLGGGYYEPILAMLHPDDRRRQLERLSERIEDLFDERPEGAWLAERVWEPRLAAELAGAGYRFTLLDDRHFADLGWSGRELYSVFATGDGDESLAVFPIDEPIRYLIPWKPPAATLDYLSGARGGGSDRPPVVVIMSDAEKMGLWPAKRGTTYTLCYTEGWMERFLGALADTPWLRCVRLSEALDRCPPRRLVYLPTASYDKMGVWALPTPARARLEKMEKRLDSARADKGLKEAAGFLRGTHWRNFLVKYPAAGRLHRLYLYTRRRLAGRGCEIDALELVELWDEVDRAMVNDHFWHGLFGGVYYHFLRHHSYRCLARALARLDDTAAPRREFIDYEGLLTENAVFNDHRQLLVLDTAGAVLDWVSKAPPAGLAGGFTRIAEPYHPSKTPGFTVDARRRGFARLGLLPAGSSARSFFTGELRPVYPDLEGVESLERAAVHRAVIDHRGAELELEQLVRLVRGGWRWELKLLNRSDEVQRFDLLLDAGPSPPAGPEQLGLTGRIADGSELELSTTARGVKKGIDGWRLVDSHLGLELGCRIEPAARLWSAPLRTLEGTEAGVRRSWQGLQLCWAWRIELPPAERRRLRAEFTHVPLDGR